MNKNVAFTIVQNIARVVAIIMVAFFFIPTFMVSCSGQDYHISALEIVVGLQNSSGHEVLEPHPGYAVLFLLPVIVAVFWLVCSSGIANGVITLILDGINLLVWFVLKMQAEEYCHEQYYEFECTGLYWINILMHILMFILCFYAIGTDAVGNTKEQSAKKENIQLQTNNMFPSTEKREKKGFAIASLILGIAALLLSCILAVGPSLSLSGIVAGIISLVKEKVKAMPIVGICLSVLASGISILVMFLNVIISG